MTLSEIVATASLAYRAYERLGKAAMAKGMDAITFVSAVERECQRIDKWEAESNAAEDAVFDASNGK